MLKKKMIMLLAALAGMGLLTAPSLADVLFSDSFEYGDTTDNIQDVSDWNTSSGVLFYDHDTNLTHPGLGDEAGGSFHHDFGSGNRSISRTLSIDPEFGSASPGDEWWLVGLIQLSNNSGSTTVIFSNSAASGVSDIGYGIDSSGEAFFWGSTDGGGSAENGSGVTLNADGSTYLFVVQAIFGAGGDSDRLSTINFWVDPTNTSSVAALGTPDLTDDASKFGRIGTYTQAQINLSFQSRADEIRFATTFEEALGVEVIPEPTSLALLGLGALCLARRRRIA